MNKRLTTQQKSTTTANGTKPFNKSEFINYDLSKEDKIACKAWEITLEELDQEVTRLNESGYKVSVGWDDYSGAFACFLVPQQKDMENFGLILTGRGTTSLKAVKQVLYKHLRCIGEDWHNFARGDHEPLDD